MKKIFNISYVFLIFNILYLIFFVSSASASTVYPIPELDNCRDQKECKLYCDIPTHTPACWSYGKYVMNKDILGEVIVNITYPIADLGNCSSAQECFIYCSQPKNQANCIAYAKNNGLVKKDEEEDEDIDDTKKQELIAAAKTELGCDSKNACMALCNDPANMDKCRSFAKKHGLEKEHAGPPIEIMEKAKTVLGCDSEMSCANVCQKEENRERCFEFAKENKLMNEAEIKRVEAMRENKREMLEAAKTELGCDSFDSCGKICSDPDNREKCMNMGRKFGMIKGELRLQSRQTLPCTSEDECKKYCEAHPNECPGASGRPNNNASDTALSKPSQLPTTSQQKGDFLGPSGCRNEDECKAYCEKHPNECPGFPKKEKGYSPTSQTRPLTTPTLQYQPVPSQTSNQTIPYNPGTQTYSNTYQQMPANYSPSSYPNNPAENYQPPPNPSDYPH